MQRFRFSKDQLLDVDYTKILEVTLETLKKEHIFQLKSRRIDLQADTITQAVMKKPVLSSSPILGRAETIRAATIHFSESVAKRFEALIEQMYSELQRQFEQEIAPTGKTPQTYMASLLTTLESLQQEASQDSAKGVNLGFAYSFGTQENLKRKRLHLATHQPQAGSPLLRLSRLDVRVSGLNGFQQQVLQSLTEVCNLKRCLQDARDEEEAEELHDDLMELLDQMKNEPESDIAALQEFLETETLGQLKKVALLKYLEYLDYQIEKRRVSLDKTVQPNRSYLQTLIYRLQRLDYFIKYHALDDGYYQVSYNQLPANFRDLFARSDAWGKLPIIPIVEGSLGETLSRDRGENSFHFGMKLKMGGKVPPRPGKSTDSSQDTTQDVLFYYLNLLDSRSPTHQEEIQGNNAQGFVDKILIVLLSYYFVFHKLDTPGYDPVQDVKQDILIPLKGGSPEQQKELLTRYAQEIRQSTQVRQMIQGLQILFRGILKHKGKPFPNDSHPFHLQVRKGLLAPRLTTMQKERTFFQRNIFSGTHKQALKYIQVEDAKLALDALCKLDAQIIFDDVLFYQQADSPETFSMSYDIRDIPALPVLLCPRDATAISIYQNYFSSQKHSMVLIPYLPGSFDRTKQKEIDAKWNGAAGFVQRFVYTLLTFLSLSLLLSYCPQPSDLTRRIFVPFFRLHLHPEKETTHEEAFISQLSRLFAHLFSERYLSDHQGFCVDDLIKFVNNRKPQASSRATPSNQKLRLPQGATYRMRNALSSLYGRVPRICELPEHLQATTARSYLEKLAILIVSSRESDAGRGENEYKMLTMYGEAVGIERLSQSQVRIATIKTFSFNTDNEKAYSQPVVLADTIGELYNQGYRHIMYVAHSPHTSRLRIAATPESADARRYFMSSDVLRTMVAGREDLIIYPVFFDKYYVVRLEKPVVDALYIQDVQELSELMQDPSQRIVTFFHLFNGQTVDDPYQNKYSGVMAYSTFWNFYEEIVANQDIHLGLLYDKGTHPSLKDDILTYLTLFHFTRCEKSVGKPTLKLDPYEDIIGDESIGSYSMLPHYPSSVSFNMLSYLTRVRGIIHKLQEEK